MGITKETLHNLIEMVDTQEYLVLFQLLMKFVPTDTATEEEAASIEIAKQQIANGEYLKASEIDWDNLDSMDLN